MISVVSPEMKGSMGWQILVRTGSATSDRHGSVVQGILSGSEEDGRRGFRVRAIIPTRKTPVVDLEEGGGRAVVRTSSLRSEMEKELTSASFIDFAFPTVRVGW